MRCAPPFAGTVMLALVLLPLFSFLSLPFLLPAGERAVGGNDGGAGKDEDDGCEQVWCGVVGRAGIEVWSWRNLARSFHVKAPGGRILPACLAATVAGWRSAKAKKHESINLIASPLAKAFSSE